MQIETENTTEKVLRIRQKTAYSGERILQNAGESDKSLFAQYSRFARISSLRSFFIIVRE